MTLERCRAPAGRQLTARHRPAATALHLDPTTAADRQTAPKGGHRGEVATEALPESGERVPLGSEVQDAQD